MMGSLDTVQDFLCELGMKTLWKSPFYTIGHDTNRPTKINERAQKD